MQYGISKYLRRAGTKSHLFMLHFISRGALEYYNYDDDDDHMDYG